VPHPVTGSLLQLAGGRRAGRKTERAQCTGKLVRLVFGRLALFGRERVLRSGLRQLVQHVEPRTDHAARVLPDPAYSRLQRGTSVRFGCAHAIRLDRSNRESA
jgi:hypothetical protein